MHFELRKLSYHVLFVGGKNSEFMEALVLIFCSASWHFFVICNIPRLSALCITDTNLLMLIDTFPVPVFGKHDVVNSEIPLLGPPKIKTSYLLKTIFAKFKLLFSSFSTPSAHPIRDHLWDCPKVVFKTTFGQFQR